MPGRRMKLRVVCVRMRDLVVVRVVRARARARGRGRGRGHRSEFVWKDHHTHAVVQSSHEGMLPLPRTRSR